VTERTAGVVARWFRGRRRPRRHAGRDRVRRRVQVRVPAELPGGSLPVHTVRRASPDMFASFCFFLKKRRKNSIVAAVRAGTGRTRGGTSCGRSWTCSSSSSPTGCASGCAAWTWPPRRARGTRGAPRAGTPASSAAASSGRRRLFPPGRTSPREESSSNQKIKRIQRSLETSRE
jgi:hypothetical protein